MVIQFIHQYTAITVEEDSSTMSPELVNVHFKLWWSFNTDYSLINKSIDQGLSLSSDANVFLHLVQL